MVDADYYVSLDVGGNGQASYRALFRDRLLYNTWVLEGKYKPVYSMSLKPAIITFTLLKKSDKSI